ncbi:MAG: helix-turn-helix domain-containing protein [Bauldia sp.]|nr:helix-turn-helix domain-containing protein [Bauldia sp.]
MRRYSLEEWRDLARAFYDVRLKTDRRIFAAEAEFAGAGRLILTKVRFTPLIFSRDPANITDFDRNYLLFERYDSGAGRGVVNETPTKVDERTLHVVDMSQRYATSTTAVHSSGVLIPHEVIGFDPSRDAHYASVSRSKPRARLLETALDALEASLAEGSLQEIGDLADAFVGLVQRLLLRCREDSELQSAKVTLDLALREHIESRLNESDLSVDQLCHRFGLSRASLYRRFQEDGGVEHYIAGRRLDRCLLELCAAQPVRGQVKTVADRWGFTDPGNFSRRFRERFGVAPTDCLAACAAPTSVTAGKQHLVHYWMRKHRR